MIRTTSRLAATILLTAVLALGLSVSATADAPQPVPAGELSFEPGIACTFGLRVSSTDGKLRTNEFVDETGSTVRSVAVGTGISYTYTNMGTGPVPVAGKSVTTKAGGSATTTVINNNVATVTATGHNGLILYPSDDPAGPSTTAYRGRIVYTVDLTTYIFTLVSASGPRVDICDELG